MVSLKMRGALMAAVSIGFVAAATPANAWPWNGTGCNGVINPLVWGCAPWDKNNGPQFPYYKKTKITIPKNQAEIFQKDGVQLVRDLRNGAVHPLLGHAGGNVIATGGLN